MKTENTYSLYDLTENDKAYLAGIFDGEGSVSLSGKNCCLRVSIELTDIDFIKELKELLNIGEISYHKPKKYNHRQTACWHCYSREAELFLKSIYTHSRIKKLEIREALENQKNFVDQRKGPNIKLAKDVIEKRNEYANKISLLKGRIK